MMETADHVGYTAQVNTEYMLFNDSCLELFYYFVGGETINLTISVLGENLTPVIQDSVERVAMATEWQSLFLHLPDGIYV